MSYQESLLAATDEEEKDESAVSGCSGRNGAKFKTTHPSTLQEDEEEEDAENEIEGEDSITIIDEEEESGAPSESGAHGSSSVRSGGSGASGGSKQKQKPHPPEGGVTNEAFVEDSDDSDTDKKKKKDIKSKTTVDPAVAINAIIPADAQPGPRKSVAPEKAMEEGQAAPRRTKPRKKPEVVLDWWSKYYASLQAEEVTTISYV